MIIIRKLAAVDMAWLGAKVIVTEYALGVVLPLILGLVSINAGLFSSTLDVQKTALGIWLVAIAANYVPLFIYAILIAKAGTVKEEGQPEIQRAKKYGIQQIIILVPFFVVVLTIIQEIRRIQKAK